jgi:lipopolysaccharide export LptBFGC system permease protein LptF
MLGGYPAGLTLFLYLFRQIALSTLFAVGALAFVVFPAIAVSSVHRLGGVGIEAVLRYIPLVGIELLPYLASLGFLLGLVSTFGRLSADKEWTAMLMAGIHPARLFLPGFLLAAGLGFVTHRLLAEVSPRWKLEQGNFRVGALLEGFKTLAPGRTELDFGRFYLGAVARDGLAFVDVQIRVPRAEGEEDLALVARRAELGFSEGQLLVALEDARTVRAGHYFRNESPTIVVELGRLLERREKDPDLAKHMTSNMIRSALAAEELPDSRALDYRFELNRRRALGSTYLLFLLVGIPTGLWLRSGNQLAGLGLAAAYALIYDILSLKLGKDLALSGVLDPGLAAWSTNLLGLLAGGFLYWKVVRR